MKKTYFTFALLLASASMMAQTVYTNAELSSTSDVIGTARYVGMGGALGAWVLTSAPSEAILRPSECIAVLT